MKMESDKQGTPTNRQVALSTTVRSKDLREESRSCVLYVRTCMCYLLMHMYIFTLNGKYMKSHLK